MLRHDSNFVAAPSDRHETDQSPRARGPRLAAIDLGTNTVLLSIVDVRDAADRFAPVREEARVTRLGQAVDESGELHPDAMTRTFECLRQYADYCLEAKVDRVALAGTSALRDAKNGPNFRARIEEELKLPVEIVSGQREAELTFRGALSGTETEGNLFVFDIGGGSTEFAFGTRASSGTSRLHHGQSLDVGSVRMFERSRIADPPSPAELDTLFRSLRAELKALGPRARFGTLDAVVGVAGTVTSLTALALGLETEERARVHGERVNVADLERVVWELARLSIAERRQIKALPGGRADVIVVGGLWLLAICDWLGESSLIASDRGVRYGLLDELAATPLDPES